MATERILIVKLSAVGDVVHSLPALDALRRARPDAHIGWAAHGGAAKLLRGHPQIDELVVVPRRVGGPRDVLAARAALRAGGRWDCAVDMQGLSKSGWWAWVSGARRRIGFAGPASREINALFMTERVRPPAEFTVIRMNLALVEPLGAQAAGARAILPEVAADAQAVAGWARDAACGGERFVLLDTFAGWETKLWPRERWVEVALRAGEAHGLRSLVTHGPGQQPDAEALAKAIADAGGRAVVAPPTTLGEYCALVRAHATAIVGADTGPVHLAAALGVPTVMLFGPSDSRRNAPEFAGARYDTLQDFTQPCTGTFDRRCRHHAPGECMSALTPEHVVAALGRLLVQQP